MWIAPSFRQLFSIILYALPKVADNNADIVSIGCNRVPGDEGREQHQ
jgi:hypothetical protein